MKKNKKSYRLLYTILIEYLSIGILTIIFMAYQARYDLFGLINGLQVSGAILFVIGWFVFINHHGIFDVVIYGVKSFFKGFTKDPKMEKSLYEIRLSRKPMPRYLFYSMWINGLIVIAISYILYYNFYI